MTPLPPKAELYLDELGRLLAPAEPVDRIEILSGVREHLETSLADLGEASDADVDAVLRQLGSPDAVARQAVGDAPSATAPVDRGPAPVVPLLARSWVPALVAVLLGLSLLLALLLMGGLSFWTTQSPAPAERGEELGPVQVGADRAVVGLLAAVALLAGPLWLPAAVVLWASPLWAPRWKAIGTLVPALPILGPSLALLALPLGLPGLVVATIGGVVLLVLLVRVARPPAHP